MRSRGHWESDSFQAWRRQERSKRSSSTTDRKKPMSWCLTRATRPLAALRALPARTALLPPNSPASARAATGPRFLRLGDEGLPENSGHRPGRGRLPPQGHRDRRSRCLGNVVGKAERRGTCFRSSSDPSRRTDAPMIPAFAGYHPSQCRYDDP
jgi:hypothetical protein